MKMNPVTSENKENYTVAEAADRAGITERAAWLKIYRGHFPHRRWGRRVIVPKSELEAFLEALPGVSAEEALTKAGEERS